MSDRSEPMLVVEKGMRQKAIPLDQQVCVLGASPSADVFIDNPFVSRLHAQIVQDGGGFRIRDLDSRNGTFVNGTRVTSAGQLLQVGDRIELAQGQVLLRFQARSATRVLPTAQPAAQSDLVVDARSREVWVQGSKLVPPLSRKEFDVLAVLSQRKGEACSKDEIAVAGWPERDLGDIGDQEIEQVIRRVRVRIEPDRSSPRYVVTVRGYGYKLSDA